MQHHWDLSCDKLRARGVEDTSRTPRLAEMTILRVQVPALLDRSQVFAETGQSDLSVLPAA